MRKIKWIIFGIVSCFVLNSGQATFADGAGSLQLNPNVITGSDGGVGTNDFPIRGELFTAEMNQKTQEKSKDLIPTQRQSLNFSKARTNTLYDTDTGKISQQLFINYKPQVITSEASSRTSDTAIWLWLISIVGILLVLMAIYFGKRNAKRSLRKQKYARTN